MLYVWKPDTKRRVTFVLEILQSVSANRWSPVSKHKGSYKERKKKSDQVLLPCVAEVLNILIQGFQ